MKFFLSHRFSQKTALSCRCFPLLALMLAVLLPLLPLNVRATPDAPQIITGVLPEAVAGEHYMAKIVCTDPDAEFTMVDDPGQGSSFGKTGLTFSKDGTISGTPIGAGLYTFGIVATGAGGEDYRVYSLFVSGDAHVAVTQPTTAPSPAVTEPVATEPDTEVLTEPAATEPATELGIIVTDPVLTEPAEPVTQPAATPTQPDTPPASPPPPTVPGWLWGLIGLAAAGIAAFLAMLLGKRK